MIHWYNWDCCNFSTFYVGSKHLYSFNNIYRSYLRRSIFLSIYISRYFNHLYGSERDLISYTNNLNIIIVSVAVDLELPLPIFCWSPVRCNCVSICFLKFNFEWWTKGRPQIKTSIGFFLNSLLGLIHTMIEQNDAMIEPNSQPIYHYRIFECDQFRAREYSVWIRPHAHDRSKRYFECTQLNSGAEFQMLSINSRT